MVGITQETNSNSTGALATNLNLLLKDFVLYLKSISFSSFSITAYQKDCRDFISYSEQFGISPDSIGVDVFSKYSTYLTEVKEVKPSSLRRKLLAIRKFLAYLNSKNILSIPQNEIVLPLRDDSLPQNLKTQSISKIVDDIINLQQTPSSLKELRDQAIFLLLALEGLKSREIIYLDWSCLIVSSEGTTLKIPGNKARLIEISDTVTKALLRYKQALLSELESLSSNMFVCFKSRSYTTYENLSPDGIKFIIREISDKYRVKLNAELLRHYAIYYMLTCGKSIADVKAHLGLKRDGSIGKHSKLISNLNPNRQPSQD